MHKYIRDDVYVVFFPYLLGNLGWVDVHVLMVEHVSSEVEIGDVNTEVVNAMVCVINGDVDVHYGIGN